METPEITATLITEIEFSIRTMQCLKRHGISTLGDLVKLTETELLKIEHFGRKSLNEVKEVLNNLKLQLATPIEDIGTTLRRLMSRVDATKYQYEVAQSELDDFLSRLEFRNS